MTADADCSVAKCASHGLPELDMQEQDISSPQTYAMSEPTGICKSAGSDRVVISVEPDQDMPVPGSQKTYALLPSISTLSSCTSAQKPECVLCEQKPRLSAFCVGVDVNCNASPINNISSGIKRADLLYTKLQNAQFDLSLANCHFQWNPQNTEDLWRHIHEWLKTIESDIRTRMMSTVPEVVFFCFSGPQKGGFLLPLGNVFIDELDLEIYGISLGSILKLLHALEHKLAPKSLLCVVMIDTITAAPCRLATNVKQPSRCVIIPTCAPHVADASQTSLFPFDILLNKMFELGYSLSTALKRSFQTLEDDGHSGLSSPHNLECIFQDFALRPSVKFEFALN